MRIASLITVCFLLFTTQVEGKEYESSFGFTIDLPGKWLAITKKQIQTSSGANVFDFNDDTFASMDKNVLEQTIALVKQGRIEAFLNTESKSPIIVENINVFEVSGKIPRDDNELSRQCKDLPRQLSYSYRKNINVYECKFETVNNVKFFMFEANAPRQGVRNINYSFQKTPSAQVLLSIGFPEENAINFKQELQKIISSIKLQGIGKTN